MKKIVSIILIWLVTIFLVNKISARLIPDRTSYELSYPTPFTFSIAPLLNMDGRAYLNIACYGYPKIGTSQNLRAFFPVYPLIVRSLSVGCQINPVLVGLGISVLFFVAAIYFLWRILGKKVGEKTIVLLIVFPTAFFFIAYYTESLFLFLSVMVFWFLGKKKLFYAAIFAAIASGTRIVGLALTAPIIYQAYRQYKKNKTIHFEVFLSPLGFVGYAFYNWMATGSLFTFISSQKYWDRPVGLLAPFYAIKSQVASVILGPLPTYDSPFVYPVIVIELATLIYLLSIIILSYKKIDMSYWLYLVTTCLIILFGGILSASPRYVLVLFPIYIFIASRLSGVKYCLYLIVSTCLFVFMTALFLRGYWVS
jgi:Gpi18-like mannosyltransferase